MRFSELEHRRRLLLIGLREYGDKSRRGAASNGFFFHVKMCQRKERFS